MQRDTNDGILKRLENHPIPPSYVIAVVTILVFTLLSILDRSNDISIYAFVFAAGLYGIAELLSVQVSDIQRIHPGSALVIYASLVGSAAFGRDIILLGALFSIIAYVIFPLIKARSFSIIDALFMSMTSASNQLLALTLALPLSDQVLLLWPRAGINIFSRTIVTALIFYLSKSVITIVIARLNGICPKTYIEKYRSTLVFEGLITNLFTIIATLSLLTISRLLSTRYMMLIHEIIVLPVFLLGAFLLRNRYVISQRLSLRVGDLELLNTLTQKLSTNLDPDKLTEEIYEEILHRLDVQGFYIALYDERNQLLNFPIVFEQGGRLDGHDREMGEGLSEYIIENRQPLLLAKDPVNEARKLGLEMHYRLTAPKSYLGVPIIYEDRVLGVLAVRHYEKEFAFDEEDRRLLETIAAAAGAALHNATQYNLLQRQTRELTSLSQIASILEENTGHREFIQSAAATLIELTRADVVAITFVELTAKKIGYHHNLGLPKSFQEQYLQGLIDHIESLKHLNSTKTYVFSRSDPGQAISGAKPELLEKGGIESIIEVLYRLENVDMVGSIFVAFNEARDHEAEIVQLIEIVGSQIAIAFSNARLLTRVFTRNAELEALYQASAGMIKSLNVISIVKTIATYLLDMVDVTSCSVCLASEDQKKLELITTAHWKNQVIALESPADILAFPLTDIWEKITEPVKVAELLPQLDSVTRDLFKRCEVAHGMLYPMRIQNKLIGFILLGTEQVFALEEGEFAYIQVIANLAATALSNARLYEQTETSLRKRLEELEALETIMAQIALGQNISDVAAEVIKAAYTNTGAELIELLRYDDDTLQLSLVAQMRGGRPVKKPTDQWALGDGLIGYALQHNEMINCPDVTAEKNYRPAFEGTRSEMVIPLFQDEGAIGVLNLESKRPAAFAPENERFIINLARQASIAFQNLAMIEQVSQQAEEFRALRNIAIDMLSSKDLEDMLHLIVEQAVTYTDAENIHIYLVDDHSFSLKFGASRWRDGKVDRRIPTPKSNELPYQVVKSGNMMYTTDKVSAFSFKSTHELREMEGTSPGDMVIIGIPLKQGKRVIGVFDIVFDRLSQLSEESLHFLELLGAQAAEAITKVRYEETVRSTRDRLQAILNSTQDGIAMFNESGFLVSYNRQAKELFDLEIEEGEAVHFAQVFKKDSPLASTSSALSREAIKALFKELRASGSRSTRREYKLSPSNTIIEETSYPVMSEAGIQMGWIFIFRDITRQKDLEVYRQDMSNMIVHDLRSPLSGVITGVQMALSDILVMPENESKHFLVSTLSIASQSANALLELIENLLDVNKLESGSMPLIIAPCNLLQISRDARSHLDTIFRVEEIDFAINSPDSVPDILADESKMERVLINLLDNSLHFTPRHGKIRVTIAILEDGSQQVTVSDSGPGIAREMRESVFERFTQDRSKQRLRGGKGSGLGLTFCKLTVEAHGGSIWISESELGGATIHFILPPKAKKQEPLFL